MKIAILAPALVLFAAPVGAQSFYVDLSADTPGPSASYGGATGVPGVWNSIDDEGIFPLLDRSGAAGAAFAEVIQCGGPTTCFDCGPSNCPSLPADDAALLNDWWTSPCLAAPPRIFLRNLLPGTYQVFVIGYIACEPNLTVTVQVNGTSVTSGGTPFLGTWEDFNVGVVTIEVVSGIQVLIPNTTLGGLAGFQVVRLGDAPTAYCTGYLGACPCGAGAPDRGCPTSFNAQGASLGGSGAALVGADSLVLSASGVSNSVVTIFQGTAVVNGGTGTVFGDGLRCAGGSTIRIASKLATGGQVAYPEPGETAISVRGAVPPTGGFRTYQVWYRNAAAYCTTSTFNLTNGVALVWR